MTEAATITLSFPEADIALLTFDMPDKGANVLSRAVMQELSQRFDALENRTDLAGLAIVSNKPGIFIAGADISEFVASLEIGAEEMATMCRFGQSLFKRLSSMDFPSIAAINGICVGGGAELAVWCDRRIMTTHAKTEIGFPEVKLGIFPGWGGTARLPRIVGLSNAVEMITGGESLNAADAYKMGLAEDIVAEEDLQAAAIRMIREEQETGAYLKDRTQRALPIKMNPTELGFLGATASAYIQQQTKGQYPAPLAALEVLLGGSMEPVDAALEMEATGMSQLFGTPVNAALFNVFFLTDRNKKDAGIISNGVQPRKIERASVIGAGIMGCGIAAANLKRGVPVCLSDAAEAALQRGVRLVIDEVAYDKQTKQKNADRAIEYSSQLNATTSDSEIAQSDLVIEAVVETLELKKRIYSRLEPQLNENAILASNTSTLPITQLAKDLKRPEQFIGIHFFNPVRKMKLVEVIRGEKTSDETVATAVGYAKSLGKFPIVVNDGPGFLVNRLLFPYMNEAMALLQEGVEIARIDKAAKRFGMPMGPITLYDMVGIDTSFYAGRTMYDAFPKRTVASPILPALVKAGRLGQKSGKGFFNYENKKRRAQPDPDVQQYIQPYLKPTGEELSDAQISDRLFLPMLLEATQVIEANIVRNVRDIDLGLIFGLGFPPYKGGLMFWADTVGVAKLREKLKPFSGLGERFESTALLDEMAQGNKKFYQL